MAAILFQSQCETRILLPINLVQSWNVIAGACRAVKYVNFTTRLLTPKQINVFKLFLPYFNDAADHTNPAKLRYEQRKERHKMLCIS